MKPQHSFVKSIFQFKTQLLNQQLKQHFIHYNYSCSPYLFSNHVASVNNSLDFTQKSLEKNEKIEKSQRKHENLVKYLESFKINETFNQLIDNHQLSFTSKNKLNISLSNEDISVPILKPLINNQNKQFEWSTEDVEIYLLNIILSGIQEKEIPYYPLNSHKDILCEFLFIGKEELNVLLRKARRIHRRRESQLNPKKTKEILLKFIEETENYNPTSEQYAKLNEETGLSKNQLYSFFYRQRNKVKKLTQEEKESLREWYLKNWNTLEKQESNSLEDICEQFSVSRAQMLKLLWIIGDEFHSPHQKVTKAIKKQINIFLKENPNPQSSQIKQLQEQLGISKNQLYSLISRFRDPPGEVTPSAKELIYEYINKNEKIDMNVLQKITNLSRRQIHDIKRRYKNINFSVDMRQQLEEIWIEGHRDLESFVFRSSLSREQIRKWLWQKKKVEDIDETLQTHVDHQMFKYRDDLLKMNQLWDSGCRNVSKYMHISGKSREQVRKWMWRKERANKKKKLEKMQRNFLSKKIFKSSIEEESLDDTIEILEVDDLKVITQRSNNGSYDSINEINGANVTGVEIDGVIK